MPKEYNQFEQRKRDHIALALDPANQSTASHAFDAVVLRHEALPDLDFEAISLHSTRFGRTQANPFLVSSMTAGHADAQSINRALMQACAQSHWAMGVGSQRRELTDTHAGLAWQALRHEFPDVTLFSNVGIAQIINTPVAAIEALTKPIHATALIVHCNPLQECIQPEGTVNFKGCWQALEQLVKQLGLPVVIKETGCGFSQSTVKRLDDLGIAAVDVSGLGGTHWGRIEGHRAVDDLPRHRAAATFKNWGISTVQSLREAVALQPRCELWGSGGVRSGLDAAKLFALGAQTVGFAKPMLEAALVSAEEVLAAMSVIEYELKTAMFCTGSMTLKDLQEKTCP